METTTKKITCQEFRQMEFDENGRFFYAPIDVFLNDYGAVQAPAPGGLEIEVEKIFE